MFVFEVVGGMRVECCCEVFVGVVFVFCFVEFDVVGVVDVEYFVGVCCFVMMVFVVDLLGNFCDYWVFCIFEEDELMVWIVFE